MTFRSKMKDMTKFEMIKELISHSSFKCGEDRGYVYRIANSRKKERKRI